jgi:hypothetical protein
VTTLLLVAFLAAHGLVHLAVWLPEPDPEAEKPPPFAPDHSAVLTVAAVPQRTAHRLAVALAWFVASAYVLGAVLVAFDAAWAAPVLVVAASAGLALKALYFNPWLSLGVLLDALVLSAAVAGWPVSVG